MTEQFVLAWTTSKNSPEKCWVMVLHSERGWELPGGKIGDDEEIDVGSRVGVEDELEDTYYGVIVSFNDDDDTVVIEREDDDEKVTVPFDTIFVE